jgi:hypothetical protein
MMDNGTKRGTLPRLAYDASLLAHYSAEQLAALKQLYDLARRHPGTGGGRRAMKFLLGLYNGPRFPFDLTDLRCFDRADFEAAMTVLRMDAQRTYAEVHSLLDAIHADTASTGAEFEHWAYELRLRGRCKKEALDGDWRIR